MKKTIFIFLSSLLLTANISAKEVNSNAGTSAFPFLKINISARAVGMGSAFTGLADDESALYYNPAGITSIENKRLIIGYQNLYSDLQAGFIGFLRPWGDNKVVGFYTSYLNYGTFTETNQLGDVTGEFSGGDLLLAATLAYKKSHQYHFGGSLKLIYEKISEYSASGIAMDLGFKYNSDRNRYGAGIAVKNLGFQLSSLGAEKDKLPALVRSGVFYKPKGLSTVIASDIIVPFDNDPIFALGAEYYNLKPLYLRLGWNSFGNNFRSDNSSDNWAGLAMGFGFDYKSMQISYAFTPAAELGESHRITFTGGI